MIGQMRQRVTIQSVTQTPNGSGGFFESWGTFTTVWASIEPVTAAQKFGYMQLSHEVTHKIIVRFFSGLTSAMRILYGTRIFAVQSYRDFEERNRFLEIMAKEGVPA